MHPYTILKYDAYSFLVQWDTEINKSVNQFIHLAAKALSTLPETEEVVPAYTSLLWISKSPVSKSNLITNLVKRTIESVNYVEDVSNDLIQYYIPVCYEDAFAPDIHELSTHTGLNKTEIISIHTSVKYHVYMMGFLPGFPFLGGLDSRLHMPRKNKPRPRVPGGSVGIGGHQTGIYPTESPGGWNLIGRCPIPLFLPEVNPPLLISANADLHFKAINLDKYQQLFGRYSYYLENPEELKNMVQDASSF